MIKVEEIRLLIETATTTEKVESIMAKYTAFESVEEKISFLESMFDDVQVVHEPINSSKEDTYQALLAGIVRKNFS